MDTEDHIPGGSSTLRTACCIAGGGPAGMMLGFLLARAGIDVLVLEKHRDFLRDFRGDTIHPSTLEVLSELGLLDEFLSLPHEELSSVSIVVGGRTIPIADFGALPTRCKFIAFMPQWDFLNFLALKAQRYPCFHLRMEWEVTELVMEEGQVAGVVASTPDGRREVRATLVVGADGRHSTVRASAGLPVEENGVPIDVLWMRIPKSAGAGEQALGYVREGRFMVLIDRGDYYQCGFIIPKGEFTAVQSRGLPALQESILRLAPFLGESVAALEDWNQVQLLTVRVDHLLRWHAPGLLCIGDAAHAMSPAGGVGINLALQDAVAAANTLAAGLRRGAASDASLERVQRRRAFPARVVQRFQIGLHRSLFRPSPPAGLRLFLRLATSVPLLRCLPAWFIGVGVRPEHVLTPEKPVGA